METLVAITNIEQLKQACTHKRKKRVLENYQWALEFVDNSNLSDSDKSKLLELVQSQELSSYESLSLRKLRAKIHELRVALRKDHGFIPKNYFTSVYIAIGLCMGVALGSALMDPGKGAGVGIAIGLAVGAGIGQTKDRAEEKKGHTYKNNLN